MLARNRLRRRAASLTLAGLLPLVLIGTIVSGTAPGQAYQGAHEPDGASPAEIRQLFHRQAGARDLTRPRTIAPALEFATYIGGRGEEIGRGIAVDAAGYAYVVGSTTTTDLAADGSSRSGRPGDVTDVFVAKLSPDGQELVYLTYLGGSGVDQGLAIAVDATGHAYVTGRTESADFPTAGAVQPSPAGWFDAFVAKLSPDGSHLIYSTYLGGSGYDDGLGIATDAVGNAYVTGLTRSRDFPTVAAFQPMLTGFADGFVAKLDPTGGTLTYATFLGGSDVDNGLAIATDASGHAYVTGRTRSTDFPRLGAIQAVFAGSFDDAFITKLSADGSALVYSTYLGGSGEDDGRGIAVDPADSAYVTGLTRSTDFPTMHPLQANRAEGIDAFVAKVSPDGSELVYSTYLGGGAFDDGVGIAADAAGRAYVTGSTASSGFPTRRAVQSAHAGGFADAHLAVISADGSTILFASFLGGSGYENGFAVAINGPGNAYITGLTRSPDLVAGGAVRSARSGPSDAFVARIILPEGALDGSAPIDDRRHTEQ